MEGFSIDDVRDTIGTDITRFLDRIEQAAVTLGDPRTAPADAAPPLQIIGDAGHAIYGTSALVGADSLATTARLIERLADHAKHELALAARHFDRAKELTLAARQGASEMRSMLGLELEHQGADAREIAREWQERTHQMLAALAELPKNGAVPAVAVEHAPAAPASDPMAAELRAVFHEEAREILAAVRAELAVMLADPANLNAARALERQFHTLKGAAATVGLAAVSDAAALLQKRLQEVADDGARADAAFVSEVIADSARLLSEAGLPAESLASIEHESATTQDLVLRHEVPRADPELWGVFEEECAELLDTLERGILALEESEHAAEDLSRLLPTYHTLKGVVNTMNLTPTGELLHRVEDSVQSLLAAERLAPPRRIATALLAVQAEVRRNLDQARQGYVELDLSTFGAQLASIANVGADDETRSRPVPAEEPLDEHAARRVVRVSADRLDDLMNLAGELVVSRSRLTARVQALRSLELDLGQGSRRLIELVEQFSEEHDSSRLGAARPISWEDTSADPVATEGFSDLELDRYEDVHVLARQLAELGGAFGETWKKLASGLEALTDDSDAFGAIVGGIRSEVTRARMVPLEVLFAQLKLPVRDAAMRESKQVGVATRGPEVQLDKTIADALLQPMLHLVRNAVVHGIESPDARDALGKPRTGVIELSAREELGQVILEVRDDGAGLDLAKLRELGVRAGLVAEGTPLDDPAIKELIFAPGLSTEEHASAVAGRGLGCDVVRRAVERLNGSIRVETEAGRGTVFILTLPVTLAITKALLIRQGDQSFAVPLYFAERILDAPEHELVDTAGIRRIRIDDAYLPITRLARVLGVEAPAETTGPLVVLRMASQRMVLEVDAVAGQEEVVVKNLGAVLAGHALFSGVTIRGTGELVLILDVPALIEARETAAMERRKRALRAMAIDGAPPPFVPVLREEAHADTVDVPVERLRVLFVDDSLSVRKVAERMFAELDADVTLAVDGVDAIAKLSEGMFDVVFTDLEMPRMHGFELIGELRARPAWRELPIVVVTSRSATKHKDHARALGASEYLTKPFTPESLASALEKWGRPRNWEAL